MTTQSFHVQLVPIDTVTPYSQNPRNNTASIEPVMRSLSMFGWRQPIVVDREMVVVVGHTRLEAARRLGMTDVPVHIASDLPPDKARAYRLADNRVGERSTWLEESLNLELVALDDLGFDMAPLGFEAVHLGDLSPEEPIPEPPADPTTRTGDLIHLGQHRLICGDSSDPDVWKSLLEGTSLDAVWTDPPYAVDYQEKEESVNRRLGRKAHGSRADSRITNDDLTAGELHQLLESALGHACEHSRTGAPWYVAGPAGVQQLQFAAVLHGLGIWRQTLVWAKDVHVMGRSDYHYRHEMVFYGWKPGSRHTWRGGRGEDTLLEFPRPKSSDLHPTMKPVELVVRCLENSTAPGAIVGDPFGGSGTTLIASERIGRRAALIEIDPGYCDVIMNRWSALTGGTPRVER